VLLEHGEDRLHNLVGHPLAHRRVRVHHLEGGAELEVVEMAVLVHVDEPPRALLLLAAQQAAGPPLLQQLQRPQELLLVHVPVLVQVHGAEHRHARPCADEDASDAVEQRLVRGVATLVAQRAHNLEALEEALDAQLALLVGHDGAQHRVHLHLGQVHLRRCDGLSELLG